MALVGAGCKPCQAAVCQDRLERMRSFQRLESLHLPRWRRLHGLQLALEAVLTGATRVSVDACGFHRHVRAPVRDQPLAEVQQPTVVFEACGSAHYWARQLQPFGHTVRLLPAHDVRRYVRRNKTDRTDAKGMLEANRNEEIHPVPVKTIDQQRSPRCIVSVPRGSPPAPRA